MSATTDTPEFTTLDLRQMDREEARNTLPVAQFERWEKLHENIEEAEQVRADFEDAAEQTHDILINADAADLASEVSIFGNDLLVYYGPEDPQIRSAVEELFEIADTDPDDADELTADDINEEQVAEAKDALVDLVTAAVVTWNGHRYADLSERDRRAIRDSLSKPRPEGWGVAGLMDAWTLIQTAVEQDRDERVERIRKFRNPERRGDR